MWRCDLSWPTSRQGQELLESLFLPARLGMQRPFLGLQLETKEITRNQKLGRTLGGCHRLRWRALPVPPSTVDATAPRLAPALSSSSRAFGRSIAPHWLFQTRCPFHARATAPTVPSPWDSAGSRKLAGPRTASSFF